MAVKESKSTYSPNPQSGAGADIGGLLRVGSEEGDNGSIIPLALRKLINRKHNVARQIDAREICVVDQFKLREERNDLIMYSCEFR
jgi:hypothetical protein